MWTRFITPGAIVTRGYGERLLKDVRPDQFARKPIVNGVLVDINHPAFVFGHLALYPVQMAEMLGLPSEELKVPPSYPDLFKMGVPCHDDPTGELYPSMQELTGYFFRGTDTVIRMLDKADPARFDAELEDPRRRERFGTVGAFIAYLLLAHPQSHFGQLSGWRRCWGLGPA